MGCGTSRVREQAVAEPVSVAGENKPKAVVPENGEPSQCRNENFDCDPEDEASASTRASKAVNLIIRAYSPVSLPNAPPVEEEKEDEDEEEEKQVLKAVPEREEKPDADDEEDASSETILSPGKSPDVSPDVRKEYQGVDDVLPRAAAAALEAIVKSAEDDVQAMKVVAAVAAVGDILFGGKEETEVKLEKCQTLVRTLAEVDVATINTVLRGEAPQAGFLLSGTPRGKQQPDYEQQSVDTNRSTGSPKSSFLFDYCQKLGMHNDYRISPPSTSPTSEADTLSMVQDFLEEIDLTKELADLPPTPRVPSKTKHLCFSNPCQV